MQDIDVSGNETSQVRLECEDSRTSQIAEPSQRTLGRRSRAQVGSPPHQLVTHTSHSPSSKHCEQRRGVGCLQLQKAADAKWVQEVRESRGLTKGAQDHVRDLSMWHRAMK